MYTDREIQKKLINEINNNIKNNGFTALLPYKDWRNQSHKTDFCFFVLNLKKNDLNIQNTIATIIRKFGYNVFMNYSIQRAMVFEIELF